MFFYQDELTLNRNPSDSDEEHRQAGNGKEHSISINLWAVLLLVTINAHHGVASLPWQGSLTFPTRVRPQC